jgi:serine/threonine-protein kinase
MLSRQSILLAPALVVSLLAASAAESQSLRVYANERFGTTAEVPATWKADPPPENGDGLIFRSSDRHASITVSGSLHVADTIEEEMQSYERPASGGKVTYRQRGRRSLVISGTRGETIFYEKHLLSCRDQVWNNLYIEYPARERATYDALVVRVSRSLRAGHSEQVEECNS